MNDTTTVYYEPAHDVNTVRTITDVLADRGYVLDFDASTVRYSPVLKTMVLHLYPHYSVEVCDGRLQLCTVDGETDLTPIESFESATAYADAIADALDTNRGR